MVAHVPNSAWTLWIPARFGFSDATEIFVFLSGMASAIAFGGTFDRRGLGMLTARVAQRIWRIGWARVCLFVTLLALMVRAGPQYVDLLNLGPALRDPGLILDPMRLAYVPNYFDILPMYMVILALMPVLLLAERTYPARALDAGAVRRPRPASGALLGPDMVLRPTRLAVALPPQLLPAPGGRSPCPAPRVRPWRWPRSACASPDPAGSACAARASPR